MKQKTNILFAIILALFAIAIPNVSYAKKIKLTTKAIVTNTPQITKRLASSVKISQPKIVSSNIKFTTLPNIDIQELLSKPIALPTIDTIIIQDKKYFIAFGDTLPCHTPITSKSDLDFRLPDLSLTQVNVEPIKKKMEEAKKQKRSDDANKKRKEYQEKKKNDNKEKSEKQK